MYFFYNFKQHIFKDMVEEWSPHLLVKNAIFLFWALITFFNNLKLIMVIELSGVQFGLKSYAWFQNWTSAHREFDLKSLVWFQTKIARHEVQLPLYYIHFEIAQIQDLVSSNISLMQYWAGLKLNSSIFGGEKVRVLETKVAKFATWYSLSFIFLQFDLLL